MRVRFVDQAKEDLKAINEYYREIGGKKLASTMLARIKGPVLTLRDAPEIAQAYELAPGVRRLVVAGGAFLVFYQVDNEIEVLHVRRAEREPVGLAELNEAKGLVKESIDDPRPSIPHEQVMAKAQAIINAARNEDVER